MTETLRTETETELKTDPDTGMTYIVRPGPAVHFDTAKWFYAERKETRWRHPRPEHAGARNWRVRVTYPGLQDRIYSVFGLWSAARTTLEAVIEWDYSQITGIVIAEVLPC